MSDEFEIIAKYFRPLTFGSGDVSAGLSDDVAWLTAPPGNLVITTDGITEGVHYFHGENPELVARKLLRVNLSDLAAKGAKPLYYTLFASFPRGCGENYIASFAQGLKKDQQEFAIHLIGGDTVASSGAGCFSVTAFGELVSARKITRSDAVVGDNVFVSGTIGDAFLGYQQVSQKNYQANSQDNNDGTFLINRLKLPTPRLDLATEISGNASSSMDISDGLIQSLRQICAASKVGMQINIEAVPLSSPAKLILEQNHPELLYQMISWGDDYEVLITSGADEINGFTKIGVVTSDQTYNISFNGDNLPFSDTHGYLHRF
jgi:thiamine-monophosphate kinase